MMDQRQPDDVSARKRIVVTDTLNFELSTAIFGHRRPNLWTPAAQQSRITPMAGGRFNRPAFIESKSGEFPVADIVVQCPRTGTPVPTGLKTEWVFLRSLPRVAIPLRCPACGQTHKWQPHQAWIAPTLQASPADSGAETANAEASPR